MKFIPHDYQKYAIDFIKNHNVSALLLDMGLGKTVTTLTAINDLMYDSFEISNVLIIGPLRVARDTWSQEMQKMGASQKPDLLRCSRYRGRKNCSTEMQC